MKPIAISGDVYIARVETVKPRYIYFRGGRITFNLSDREDLYPESQSNKAKKLDNIVIEKEEKGRYYAIRKIYFIYSYFSGNGDAASRRLCLDAVTECGLAGEESVNKPIASFEYYGKDSLPNKYSNSIDYWGYYNGKSNDGSIPKTDFSSYKAAFGIMGNADRTSDEKYMQYGSNGAMTRDPNKGMSIEYADNGTPRTIRFDNGNSISYICGADGEKLKTEWTSRGDAFRPKAGTTTGGGASAVPAATNSEETFGPFVYIDGRLAEVRFDDGYCTIDSSGRADYHYFVRDYIGSVCVVTDDEGNIEQQNAYYAWGGIYSAMSVNPALQDRKYSGKPFDRRHGLDLYDYGARRYDPALARWTSPDPLCEYYYNISPYAFCHDNPVNRIDIDGCGDYYTMAGLWLGSDGKQDGFAYTATGVHKEKNSRGSLMHVFENAVRLSISNDKLFNFASTVYGESSIGYGIFSKEEMFAIASILIRKNKVAFGINSSFAKQFRKTKYSMQTAAMQTANAAVINAIMPNSEDYSKGADQWDGAEQAMLPWKNPNIPSNGSFMYKINVMGWSIGDEEYASWKKAVKEKFGSRAFNVPQRKAAVVNYGGMANKGRIRLFSTAQYGLTIFWRTIK